MVGNQKNSSLLTFLTVLLVVVGVIDLFLWGIVIFCLLQGTPNTDEKGATPSAAVSIEPADDEKERDPLEIYIEDMQECVALENESKQAQNNGVDTNDIEQLKRSAALLQQAQQAAEKVVPGDSEIAEAHEMGLNYLDKRLNAVTMQASALTNQDDAQLAEANNLIEKADNLVDNYNQIIERLVKERNISWNISFSF